MILDIKRCRKRALEFCADELPIFSPLDEVEEVNYNLGDFVFVDAPYTNFIRQYGYSGGKGWVHASLARWLLHVNAIQWKHIKYRLNATAHLPHSCLREPLEIIESCWADPADRELSINSLVGLWVRKRRSYHVTSSHCELDAPEGDSLKRATFYGDDKVIFDWIQQSDVTQGPATKYPLWLMVMSVEHTRVGQAIWILEKLGIPRRSLGEFKTDSIAFTPQKRQRERLSLIHI